MFAKRWQERVLDILAAIAEIESFISGLDNDGFLADPKTQKAVVANLTIIGEAARYVPDEVAEIYSEIPWVEMRGMRNRIVHGYYEVDPNIVWTTCAADLPPLVATLKQVVAENP